MMTSYLSLLVPPCAVFPVCTEELWRTSQEQFPNFQIHFIERSFRRSRKQDQVAGSVESPRILGKSVQARLEEN